MTHLPTIDFQGDMLVFRGCYIHHLTSTLDSTSPKFSPSPKNPAPSPHHQPPGHVMRPELRSNSAPSPTISVDDSGIASLGETLHASLITHDHKSQLSSKKQIPPTIYMLATSVCVLVCINRYDEFCIYQTCIWIFMFYWTKREIPPR